MNDPPEIQPTRLADHPTARAVRSRPTPSAAPPFTQAVARAMALAAGADDAAAVSLDHPDLAEEVPWVRRAFPAATTLVALVARMHPEAIRSPLRSVANHEFHQTGEHMDHVARALTRALTARGHRALNPAMAFPMEMDDFPGRTWIVSHKRVALAAQLGRMGVHRSVIHPRFGSFVLLGTVITDAPLADAPDPLTFNPCFGCNLCVAACPVGALEPDGTFHFSACYDHNYREFMTGFEDLLEDVADSRDRHALRARVSASESASMWQSLAYKPNYKAAYCLAVCPAGEELLGPFLQARAEHVRTVVKPLLDREEPVYAVAGSDAEAHARKRFPHKKLRLVRSSLRPANARAMFRALPLTFQRGPAKGWRATYHFDLTGDGAVQSTVEIDDGRLTVRDGLVGDADLRVTTDAALWIDIVTHRRSPVLATLTGRLRVRGDRRLLARFAGCFPR
ncbi:MAG: SCP2 sterol-binding domain-containing protein [Polyangiales bacterium]